MSTASRLREPFDRYPLAREATVAVVLVGAFAVLVTTVMNLTQGLSAAIDLDFFGGAVGPFLGDAIVSGTVAVGAMVAFAWGYVRIRHMAVAVGPFDRSVLGYSVAGVLVGVGAVVLVKALTAVTGSSLSAAAGQWISPGADPGTMAIITGLGLLVSVPAYLLVTHVLVQRTIGRAAAAPTTIGLTTFVVAAVGPTELLHVSYLLAVVGYGLIAVAIALPAVAATYYDRRWLTVLTALPVVLLVALLAVERITDLGSLAQGLYAFANVGIIAFGVTAYQRTGSMIPSGIAVVTVSLATTAVVFALEAGLTP